jgi:hypothetical protein
MSLPANTGYRDFAFDWGKATPTGYPRPLAAVNLRVALAIAFQACTTPNRDHGPALTAPSCNPAKQTSQWATVGTTDSNGQSPESVGFVKIAAVCNPPAPNPNPPCSDPGDQADVKLELSVNDIRSQPLLGDYVGELQVTTSIRITDKLNGPSQTEAATVSDMPLSFTAPCDATIDPTIGSTCQVSTYVDAVTPGSVPESKRGNWELGQVQVLDGGPDGQAATPGNTLFAVQGVFIP